MAHPRLPLRPEGYYHIYNRGINSSDIFFENDNYEHFLKLYNKYISPIANTFAWVMMKNHFHLLVQILPPKPRDFEFHQDLPCDKRINQQFSNLFNAYTKAINKRYNRTGSLFEHSFRRKQVDSREYLKQLILYIHNNPVHHHFCEVPEDYPWSSYQTIINLKATKIHRKEVIGWFDNEANFRYWHKQPLNHVEIEEWLNIKKIMI